MKQVTAFLNGRLAVVHFLHPTELIGCLEVLIYLQAIREELTHRDDLPDYRMPQDIGLSDFNKEWGEPDLGDICKEKFYLLKT